MTCAMVDCPMPNQWPEGASCVATVDSVTQCCKSGIKCDAELESAHVCRDGNETYHEGQTITPAGDRDAIQFCRDKGNDVRFHKSVFSTAWGSWSDTWSG